MCIVYIHLFLCYRMVLVEICTQVPEGQEDPGAQEVQVDPRQADQVVRMVGQDHRGQAGMTSMEAHREDQGE